MELTEGFVGEDLEGRLAPVPKILAVLAGFLYPGIRNSGSEVSGGRLRGFVDELCVAETLSGELVRGRSRVPTRLKR
jgi:hypothetical protein